VIPSISFLSVLCLTRALSCPEPHWFDAPWPRSCSSQAGGWRR
jgi:hypothetical protein